MGLLEMIKTIFKDKTKTTLRLTWKESHKKYRLNNIWFPDFYYTDYGEHHLMVGHFGLSRTYGYKLTKDNGCLFSYVPVVSIDLEYTKQKAEEKLFEICPPSTSVEFIRMVGEE